MELSGQSTSLIDVLIIFASHWLIPLMITLFVVAVVARVLIYFTVKRQEWFSREMEKRVDWFIETRVPQSKMSFYVTSKRLLEKTYFELFRVRYAMKRRRPDVILTFADRIFMIKHGVAFLVKDILRPLKHLKFNNSNHPNLLSATKKAFARNPSFSKVFGIFPNATLNDMVNILPGIFIILGVFGTFLGITKALPDLGTMDLADVEASKAIMDQFLFKISFSMSTSLIGIVLSVCMSALNASMAPEKIFTMAVDRLEAALDCIWHMSDDNNLPSSLEEFDGNRDPEEFLALQALNEDVALGKKEAKDVKVA